MHRAAPSTSCQAKRLSTASRADEEPTVPSGDYTSLASCRGIVGRSRPHQHAQQNRVSGAKPPPSSRYSTACLLASFVSARGPANSPGPKQSHNSWHCHAARCSQEPGEASRPSSRQPRRSGPERATPKKTSGQATLFPPAPAPHAPSKASTPRLRPVQNQQEQLALRPSTYPPHPGKWHRRLASRTPSRAVSP